MSGRTEEFSWGVRVGGGVGERGERVGAVRGVGASPVRSVGEGVEARVGGETREGVRRERRSVVGRVEGWKGRWRWNFLGGRLARRGKER